MASADVLAAYREQDVFARGRRHGLGRTCVEDAALDGGFVGVFAVAALLMFGAVIEVLFLVLIGY